MRTSLFCDELWFWDPEDPHNNWTFAQFVDNWYGYTTEKMVKEFQSNTSLTVDGKVGPNTFKEFSRWDSNNYVVPPGP